MSKNVEYDLNALKEGVLKCEENIKIFEDAIEREHGTIRDYKRMIRVLEEKRDGSQNGRHN